MADFTKHQGGGVAFISLGSYLQRLRALEYLKPEESRRSVPSLNELARSINSTSSTISRIARGEASSLNIALAGAIIREMRHRGFQMEISDLIDYIGPDARCIEASESDQEVLEYEKEGE